ncbi:MAG: DUF2085 domain-containing protein [Gemmatimonadota bacterium]|nr:DUF2085 domain-containing protein [Gemmatimonadota bacterium]
MPERPPIVAFPPRLRPRAAVVLGCHGNPDRCPTLAGRRAPICARCLGFLVGNVAGLASFLLLGLPTLGWTLAGAALLVPALADALLQATTRYRSTNPRRLATGALGGAGQLLLLGGLLAHAAPRVAMLIAGG